jgi:ribosomal protein L7/L12
MLIAALREASGLGLKEAKDAVEEYGQRKAPRSPWLFGL